MLAICTVHVQPYRHADLSIPCHVQKKNSVLTPKSNFKQFSDGEKLIFATSNHAVTRICAKTCNAFLDSRKII